MRSLRFRRSPLLLLIALAGCSSTIGSKFGGSPQSRSIVVNGDRPLPASVGEPGGQVAAETAEPEPRRNPKARISGRVLDEAGKPVPDATVRLADGNSKGGRDVRVRTDRSGAFTLGGLRPGSSYWLVAEVDDDQGPRTGRVRAKTAETGVEISLGDQGDGTEPADNRATKAPRARPISDREGPDSEPSKVNDEDLAPPADEAETAGPNGKDARPAGRPRLSAPEPAVGWKKPGEAPDPRRQARTEPDPETADDLRPDPKGSRPRVGSDDDGPNPLPPAIDPGGSAQADDPSPPARPNARRKPKPAEVDLDAQTGGLTLPPESPSDDQAEAPATRPRSPRKPRANPGPPAMPSLDSTALPAEMPALATATESPSRLEPDPSVLPGSAAPAGLDPSDVRQAGPPPMPGGDALALHDPPRADGPSEFPNPIATTNPAPEPVSASPVPPIVAAVVPGPATAPAPTSNEYNPFALAAGPAPAAPAVAATKGPAVVTMSVPDAPRVDPPTPAAPTGADPSDDATPPPPPKTKWGDVAPSPARQRASSDSVRPTSLFARFRPSPTTRERDPTPAPTCEYDPKARKLVDFRLPDLEGKPVLFRDLDSDYVLLDFWGTWCNPCLDSIPHLVELQKQYGPGRLKVVGIACEKATGEQRRAKVDAFARKLGINYTVLLSAMDGSDPVQKAMGIRYYPTMILLDRGGQVLWSAEGATEPNLKRLDRTLASMIRSDSAAR